MSCDGISYGARIKQATTTILLQSNNTEQSILQNNDIWNWHSSGRWWLQPSSADDKYRRRWLSSLLHSNSFCTRFSAFKPTNKQLIDWSQLRCSRCFNFKKASAKKEKCF
mmetsp:Transcript_7979/g.14361  ORF Transcript_7979/g.14361 Transcript_7979/m.14361 type:complete len:110 (+) Transcript_7979:2699-3028(+)